MSGSNFLHFVPGDKRWDDGTGTFAEIIGKPLATGPSMQERLARITQVSEIGYIGTVKKIIRKEWELWTEYRSEHSLEPPSAECGFPGDVFIGTDSTVHLRLDKGWVKWKAAPDNAFRGQKHPTLKGYVYKIDKLEKQSGWRTVSSVRKLKTKEATSKESFPKNGTVMTFSVDADPSLHPEVEHVQTNLQLENTYIPEDEMEIMDDPFMEITDDPFSFPNDEPIIPQASTDLRDHSDIADCMAPRNDLQLDSVGDLLRLLRDTWKTNARHCPTLDVGLRIFDALARVADDIVYTDLKSGPFSEVLSSDMEQDEDIRQLVYKDLLFGALVGQSLKFVNNMCPRPDPDLDVANFISSLHTSTMRNPDPDVEEKLVSAVDVRASLSGLCKLELHLPEVLGTKVIGAPSSAKHLAALGHLGWKSAVVPRGGITHAHIDGYARSKLIAEIGDPGQLWLIWPPLKENLDYMCRVMPQRPYTESTVAAIENLKGLQLLVRFGEPIVFHLPAYCIHAVLTLDLTMHTGLHCYSFDEYEHTLEFAKLHAMYVHASLELSQDDKKERLGAISADIDMWRTLTSTECGKLDEEERTHLREKIDAVSKVVERSILLPEPSASPIEEDFPFYETTALMSNEPVRLSAKAAGKCRRLSTPSSDGSDEL
ncbi:hypothetical protein DFH11DRAFT_739582 [Phellopilus nigrolimitatus]|nr:hypothetical protein DFH11DRAFT_739582 [Phellopilus nigrolimitatus]